MSSRLAVITFLDDFTPGLTPGYPLPQPPLYPSTGPGFPTHPIAPGGQPPGIWGGAPPWVSHPIAPGGQPPYPSQGPGFPTNPIAPGGSPGHPSHPIALPPIGPDNTLPPSSPPPVVSLPIVLPDPPERDQKFELKYSPVYGWVLVPVGGTAGRPDNTLPPTATPKSPTR
jgi:hypothetical protein